MVRAGSDRAGRRVERRVLRRHVRSVAVRVRDAAVRGLHVDRARRRRGVHRRERDARLALDHRVPAGRQRRAGRHRHRAAVRDHHRVAVLCFNCGSCRLYFDALRRLYRQVLVSRHSNTGVDRDVAVIASGLDKHIACPCTGGFGTDRGILDRHRTILVLNDDMPILRRHARRRVDRDVARRGGVHRNGRARLHLGGAGHRHRVRSRHLDRARRRLDRARDAHVLIRRQFDITLRRRYGLGGIHSNITIAGCVNGNSLSRHVRIHRYRSCIIQHNVIIDGRQTINNARAGRKTVFLGREVFLDTIHLEGG